MGIVFGPSAPNLDRFYDEYLISCDFFHLIVLIHFSQIGLRSRRLIQNGNRITPSSYNSRKLYFIDAKNGLLTKKSTKSTDLLASMNSNPMMDPANMGNMMKGQFAGLVYQMYMIFMYSTIDHYFQGFIAAKLPFAVTKGKRSNYFYHLSCTLIR